ncbi:MAG: SCO family protein [Candidatus Binatia bacterium]
MRQAFRALLLSAAALGTAPASRAAEYGATPKPHIDPADAAYTYTAAPFAVEFEAPAPGSYTLPVIDRVTDHRLVDSNGGAVALTALKQDRLAVVAFVYTACGEAAGCPLAEAILQRVDRRLAEDPALARRVRLLTISFDPERDTPERMRTVRRLYAPKTDWAFLTARDEATLQPVLKDFGQPVAKLYYEDGEWTGLFRHVLKVFLLDEQNRVRNIYSTGMISPELVVNDLRTLAMENAPPHAAPSTPHSGG